jgi:hypothetical protein
MHWCGAPSLTRCQACSFQFLLGIANPDFLASGSHRTYQHILSLFFRCPQPGGPGSYIYFPQEQDSLVIPLGIGWFITPTQHKTPKRVNIFTPWISTHVGLNLYIHALFKELLQQNTVRTKVLTKITNFMYGTNTKNTILTMVYTGQSCSFLTSVAMIRVQMGEMSKLWLDDLPEPYGLLPCI